RKDNMGEVAGGQYSSKIPKFAEQPAYSHESLEDDALARECGEVSSNNSVRALRKIIAAFVPVIASTQFPENPSSRSFPRSTRLRERHLRRSRGAKKLRASARARRCRSELRWRECR